MGDAGIKFYENNMQNHHYAKCGQGVDGVGSREAIQSLVLCLSFPKIASSIQINKLYSRILR